MGILEDFSFVQLGNEVNTRAKTLSIWVLIKIIKSLESSGYLREPRVIYIKAKFSCVAIMQLHVKYAIKTNFVLLLYDIFSMENVLSV